MKVFAVELKTGKIFEWSYGEFINHFNNNDFMSADFNAYLDLDSAREFAQNLTNESEGNNDRR